MEAMDARIEARRFNMERLHRDTWGEKIQADVTHDFSQMSEDQRVAKALELIGVIKEITGPRPKPPPIVYQPEEEPDEKPGGIGS